MRWALAVILLTFFAVLSLGKAEGPPPIPCGARSIAVVAHALESNAGSEARPFFLPLRDGYRQAAVDLLADWEMSGRLMHLDDTGGVLRQLTESMERLSRLLPEYDARAIQDLYTELVWRDPPPRFQALLMQELRFFARPTASSRLTLRQRMQWAELQLYGRDRGLSQAQLLELFEQSIYGLGSDAAP